MKNILLLETTFTTPLGLVSCGLSSTDSMFRMTGDKIYTNGYAQIAETLSHQIEVITFKQKLPLYNGDTVTDCQGSLWRIKKLSSVNESIELHCLLLYDDESNVSFDIATGEHLDAIEVYNNDWTLHIGTEDTDMLLSRADQNDWMPSRFKDNGSLDKPFVEMLNNGFVAVIPDLQINEYIQIQYLMAYDKRDISKANTWLAVDEFKRNLESWIGI